MLLVVIEYFVIFLELAQNRFVCIYIFICGLTSKQWKMMIENQRRKYAKRKKCCNYRAR